MNEELLIRFLTHACSSSELKQIDTWLASDPAHAQWLFEMERIWGLKDELHFSEKKEIKTAYKRFLTSIKEPKKPLSRPQFILLFVKYTAAIILAALLVANLYWMSHDSFTGTNEINVPNGQRVSLTLCDGTQVRLNSATRFTYPSRFSRKERSVHLEGEAFFAVSSRKQIPFIVQSPLLNVKVLGTKFNMRTYSGESSVVTLAEGKVEVETINGENKLTLRPHQQASYSVDSGMSLMRDINIDLIHSWTKGEGAYLNQSLKDISRDLERKFDVQIIIDNSRLAADIFTCRFKETATIDDVMTLLKDTRRLDYTIKGQQIHIYNPKNNMPMEKH